MVCNTCILFTQQEIHSEWKNETGVEIFLQYAYNHYVPKEEEDCLKCCTEKVSSLKYCSPCAFVLLLQVQ